MFLDNKITFTILHSLFIICETALEKRRVRNEIYCNNSSNDDTDFDVCVDLRNECLFSGFMGYES